MAQLVALRPSRLELVAQFGERKVCVWFTAPAVPVICTVFNNHAKVEPCRVEIAPSVSTCTGRRLAKLPEK